MNSEDFVRVLKDHYPDRRNVEPVIFDLGRWWMAYFPETSTTRPLQARMAKDNPRLGYWLDRLPGWDSVGEEGRMKGLFIIVSMSISGELKDGEACVPLV